MPTISCNTCGFKEFFDCDNLEWISATDRVYASWEARCPDCNNKVLRVEYTVFYDTTGFGKSYDTQTENCSVDDNCYTPPPPHKRGNAPWENK